MNRLDLGISLAEATARFGKPPDYADAYPSTVRTTYGWNAVGGGIWIEYENGWTASLSFIHESRINRFFRRLNQKIKA